MIEYAIRHTKSGRVLGQAGGGTFSTREQAQDEADRVTQVSTSPWEVVERHISDWVQAGAQ